MSYIIRILKRELKVWVLYVKGEWSPVDIAPNGLFLFDTVDHKKDCKDVMEHFCKLTKRFLLNQGLAGGILVKVVWKKEKINDFLEGKISPQSD